MPYRCGGEGRGDQHQTCGLPPGGVGGSPYSGGRCHGGSAWPSPGSATRPAPAASVACRGPLASRHPAAHARAALAYRAPSQAPSPDHDAPAPASLFIRSPSPATWPASGPNRAQLASSARSDTVLATEIVFKSFASANALVSHAAGSLERPAAAAGAASRDEDLALVSTKVLAHPTRAMGEGYENHLLVNDAHNIMFHHSDASSLTSFIQKNMGISRDQKQLSVSGQNWGGSMHPFIVSSKQALEVPLADVAQTQMQGKTDVLLEFHVDDIARPEGLTHEVPTKVLSGLSSVKVTRPGSSRSCQDGCAVKSSLKAENGLLCPLEEGFFFLSKPLKVIIHEEIVFVGSEHYGTESANVPSHHFNIKLKNDQEHLFRNILRSELHSLFNFLNGRHFKIMNQGDGQGTSGGVTNVLRDTDDDAVDPLLEFIKNQTWDEESDEEGLTHEVLNKVLSGLSGARVTRPVSFGSCQDRFAVKSSFKPENGLLCPLEEVFFFLRKPPKLHEEAGFYYLLLSDLFGNEAITVGSDVANKTAIENSTMDYPGLSLTNLATTMMENRGDSLNASYCHMVRLGKCTAAVWKLSKGGNGTLVPANFIQISSEEFTKTLNNTSMPEATAARTWNNDPTWSETGTLNKDSQILTRITTEQLCASSFKKLLSMPFPYPTARKVMDLRIRHNVIIVFLLISLLATITSANVEYENDMCSVHVIDSYFLHFLPTDVCPIAHLSAPHWAHAKRALRSKKELNIFEIFPLMSLKQLGFLLVVVSCITPWCYIKNININMTDIVLFWEVKMVFIWACSLISSIIYHSSWVFFYIILHSEDTPEARSVLSMIYKNLVIGSIYTLLLAILAYKLRVVIQAYMHTRRAIHMWLVLLLCSVCWIWLSIGFHTSAFGILGWISMIPMYSTKWIIGKRFNWITFMFKAGGLIGIVLGHEGEENWWYERSYKVGIVCRVVEIIIPCYPWLRFWLSRATASFVLRIKRQLQR